MGQYYMPVLSNAREGEALSEHITAWAYSHDFDNGLKLMEHSYVGNSFTEAIVAALQKQSARVVWAGDYADPEPMLGDNLYEITHAVHNAPFKIVKSKAGTPAPYRYLINSSKKEYVDMTVLPEIAGWAGNRIHPLPLLTADGNGRGGGDFHGTNDYIGTWARDFIAVVGLNGNPPEGWTEITPNFTED